MPPSHEPTQPIITELSRQELRFRRALISWIMCFVFSSFILYVYYLDELRLSSRGMLIFMAAIWFGNMVFLAIFKTGINKRFRDPSLTMAQILWAITWLLVTTYYLNELRQLILTSTMIVALFGSFRLRVREFIGITLYAIIGYSLVILLLQRNHPELIRPVMEYTHLIGFIILSSCLCWLGTEISDMRLRLRRGNTKLREAMGRIESLVMTDELTGISNRRYIVELMEREKDCYEKDSESFSVSFMDLDHFKKVNDTHGHSVGDEVLKRFARNSESLIRGSDQLARFGGEEFLLLMPKTPLSAAVRVSERIRESIENTDFSEVATNLKVTVSVGVASYQGYETLDELLTRVDKALYCAKDGGRNRVINADSQEEAGE